jgi:RimJ/RimL family protein N-acetyltransferase
MSLPRLAGSRVSLLPVPYDVAVAALAGDPTAALARIGLRPGPGWPHEDTADALRGLAEHGSPGDESGWLIVLADDRGDLVIGDCGWMGGPGPDGDAEVGYGLAAPYRGRGLGREAVALLCAWAERQPGVRELSAQVLPGNEASCRLLLGIGFSQAGACPPYLRFARQVPGPARSS